MTRQICLVLMMTPSISLTIFLSPRSKNHDPTLNSIDRLRKLLQTSTHGTPKLY